MDINELIKNLKFSENNPLHVLINKYLYLENEIDENEEIDEQEQMKYLHQESFETERNDDRKNIKQMFKI